MENALPITAGHAVLETVIGFMGIAWSEKGLIRLCLPERSREAVERRLFRHAGVSSANEQPIPTAGPLTHATTGFGRRRMDAMAGW